MLKHDGREYLIPDWPAPAKVHACTTMRNGGVSQRPYDSFNLADHVGDTIDAVRQNRALLQRDWQLPSAPVWLTQVHGKDVLELPAQQPAPYQADASFSILPGTVCAVLTADCLPLLFCDRHGRAVAAAHAGWRGLAAGVIEATIQRYLAVVGTLQATDLLVWLGPAISPAAFEVGQEVLDAFTARYQDAQLAFKQTGEASWRADLYQLARLALTQCGVQHIYGGQWCTFTDERFFSYRRDRQTGRIATLIWRD